MNISELLAAIGDNNVQWQSLDQCADSLTMNGDTTRITFGTEQRLTLSGTERYGMVIWLDRDALKAAFATEKRDATKPEATVEALGRQLADAIHMVDHIVGVTGYGSGDQYNAAEELADHRERWNAALARMGATAKAAKAMPSSEAH